MVLAYYLAEPPRSTQPGHPSVGRHRTVCIGSHFFSVSIFLYAEGVFCGSNPD